MRGFEHGNNIFRVDVILDVVGRGKDVSAARRTRFLCAKLEFFSPFILLTVSSRFKPVNESQLCGRADL
jgi:hypothetical protein